MQPPDQLPPELEIVLAEGAFDCDDPNALSGMPEQADPVDDLAALDGCWGGCASAPATLPGRELLIAEALRFDSTHGTLERSIYQSIVIVPPMVDIQIGTVTLDEPGMATFRVTQVLSTANPTDPGALVDVTDKWDTLPVYEVPVAFDGERLIARFSEIDTPRTSGGFADRHYARHTRIECP